MQNQSMLIGFLALSVSAAVAQTGGGISGTIFAPDNSPVSGATVIYRRLPAYVAGAGHSPQLAPGEVQFSTLAITDTKGNHSANGLPPGQYVVCVNIPAQRLLDPCRWGAAPVAQVQSGQKAVLNISLQSGVFLQIRLNDPKGLLPSSERNSFDFPHVTTGVFFRGGAFLAAERASVDSAGQVYRMTIPAGEPLNLWLSSGFVQLTDNLGKAVPATGARIPFQAATGVDQNFTITVAGAVSPTAQE
jgi:hypothetical protein